MGMGVVYLFTVFGVSCESCEVDNLTVRVGDELPPVFTNPVGAVSVAIRRVR